MAEKLNQGLIAGYVEGESSGAAVGYAIVGPPRISQGDSTRPWVIYDLKGNPQANLNVATRNGYFALPFLWDPTDWQAPSSGRFSINVMVQAGDGFLKSVHGGELFYVVTGRGILKGGVGDPGLEDKIGEAAKDLKTAFEMATGLKVPAGPGGPPSPEFYALVGFISVRARDQLASAGEAAPDDELQALADARWDGQLPADEGQGEAVA